MWQNTVAFSRLPFIGAPPPARSSFPAVLHCSYLSSRALRVARACAHRLERLGALDFSAPPSRDCAGPAQRC
jgi:hypothetical protein